MKPKYLFLFLLGACQPLIETKSDIEKTSLNSSKSLSKNTIDGDWTLHNFVMNATTYEMGENQLKFDIKIEKNTFKGNGPVNVFSGELKTSEPENIKIENFSVTEMAGSKEQNESEAELFTAFQKANAYKIIQSPSKQGSTEPETIFLLIGQGLPNVEGFSPNGTYLILKRQI